MEPAVDWTTDQITETEPPPLQGIQVLDSRAWVIGPTYAILSVGFVLNLITAVAYIKSPLLTTGKPAHQLIFNVTLSDIASCLFCQPYNFLQYTQSGLEYIATRKMTCLTSFVLVIISFEVTTVALLLFSVERLIAILSPLQHMHRVTRKTCRVAIVSSWAVVIIKNGVIFFENQWQTGWPCVGIYILTPSYGYYVYMVGLYGEMGTIAILNIALGLIVIHAKRKAMKMNEAMTKSKEKKMKSKRKELKMIKVLMLAVGILMVTWIPNNTLANLVFNYSRQGLIPPRTIYLGYHMTRWATLLGALVDPIIYFWYNQQCRRAVLHLFGVSVTQKKTVQASKNTINSKSDMDREQKPSTTTA